MKTKKLSQGASGSGIFTIELYTFPNKSWVYDTGCGTHIFNTTVGIKRLLDDLRVTAVKLRNSRSIEVGSTTTQELRGSRKLKPGALSLYLGNGQRAAVEAIRTYHLCLPNELVIALNNRLYAPSITRGIILVSRMYDDGYRNRFVDNAILVSRNNLVYFSVVQRDGIFEINLSNSNAIDSSMYAASNKRAKLNLDSTLLWHYHLGHISKKRIEKFQEFLDHLKEHVIIAHRTPPYTPQQNGVLERRNRTLLDMVRSMMSQKTLPKSFWDYALETAARILNMVPTKKVEKTPYKVWHGQAPKLSYLKVWGYEALVK
ncbi:zinc finger, CCHC-type containing protein [Tanacetum coccineum]